MSRGAPVLKLDDIYHLSKRDPPEISVCHTYGIFKEKETITRDESWHLFDDSCKDLKIKLCGPLENYPIPQPGDIIRIHRLAFDRLTKCPAILNGKNVVIWRGFKEDPTPITKASNPTITEDDARRRKVLEIFQESSIVTTDMITKQRGFFNVAGQIEEISADMYGNKLLKFRDATGSFIVRVFPQRNEAETNIHFENANKFVVGDLMIANMVNLNKTPTFVNLSASTKCGRFICQIEPNSYLGRKLTVAIEAATPAQIQPPPETATTSSQTQKRPGSPETRPRRSPRLNAFVNNNNNNILSPHNLSATQQRNDIQNLPTYTHTRDIQMSDHYRFYDIAGQVRGEPNETSQYANWVFQLYDGSKPTYVSYYSDEVKEREPDCVTVLAFSKQRPNDTDQHTETVKKLKAGDLVLIKNVRAAWTDGKLKLDLSANLAHGKSITVIEKTSKFGEILDDIVCNPISSEETFHDPSMDTSMESTDEHPLERNHDD